MKKKGALIGVVIVGLLLSGCSPTSYSKQEIPETLYEEAGYAIKSEVENDGTVKITYALVGLKDKKIKYLYIDQVEQNPAQDRFTMTNKEMQNAYGLAYESNCGEWYQQVAALENYISGNHLTKEEVNEIPTYQKDAGNPKVAEKGSDLAAGCELDLTDFLEVINTACDNTVSIKATRLGLGEDIRISKAENKLYFTISLIGTDYRYKICYEHLDQYEISADSAGSVISKRDNVENEQDVNWKNNLEAFKDYIYGLNMNEAIGVETYDPGNGVETALAKPGTDLANVCNIDLSKIILTLQEASGRLG